MTKLNSVFLIWAVLTLPVVFWAAQLWTDPMGISLAWKNGLSTEEFDQTNNFKTLDFNLSPLLYPVAGGAPESLDVPVKIFLWSLCLDVCSSQLKEDTVPRNCEDVLGRNPTATRGLYQLSPTAWYINARQVYCDLTFVENLPVDCSDVLERNPSASSGVYLVSPTALYLNSLYVYCDMETERGGWMVS